MKPSLSQSRTSSISFIVIVCRIRLFPTLILIKMLKPRVRTTLKILIDFVTVIYECLRNQNLISFDEVLKYSSCRFLWFFFIFFFSKVIFKFLTKLLRKNNFESFSESESSDDSFVDLAPFRTFFGATRLDESSLKQIARK